MTREEQIEKAANKYVKDIVTPLPASLAVAFVKGAEWADEHPINYDGKAMLHVLNKGAAIGRREMLDKACDWLEERQAVDLEVPNIEKFISEFKKETKEQQ
jgi:hypothetical protein